MTETKIATVEKLAFGGMGIVRDGSTAVFVPFVIPGEKIRFKIIEGSKKPVMGELIEVLEPSSTRRNPPCAVFGRCGGCQLQHIAYKTQLKLKREIVRETFARIAKMDLPVDALIPSPSPLNYRSRVKLRIRKNRMGYLSKGGRNFVPIQYCHIARKEINAAMDLTDDILGKNNASEVEFLLFKNEVYAVLKGFHSSSTYKISIESTQKQKKDWAPLPDFQPVFQQVNEEQNENLKKLVENAAEAVKPALAVELFCGDGNLTEAIIKHSERLVACDIDEHAVHIARTRFKDKGNRIKFFHCSAEQLLEELLTKEKKADFVLLDPPRTGAKSVVPLIVRFQPKCVFYVSCDAPTMARDIALFQRHGYMAGKISPLDMFPQTAHIELTATLTPP